MRHRFIPAALALGLFASLGADAALLTVGPDGDYSSLQDALDLAVENGEDDEIRVQSGTHVGTFGTSHDEDHLMTVSGGWNASFSGQVADPDATVLDADGSFRALNLGVVQGHVIVRNLTMTGGIFNLASGLRVTLANNAQFGLFDCVVRDNRVELADGVAVAGGADFRVNGAGAYLWIDGCSFRDNEVLGGEAIAGGLRVAVTDGDALLDRIDVSNNLATGTTAARAAGLLLAVNGADDTITLMRSTLSGNRVDSPASGGVALVTSVSGEDGLLQLGSSIVRDNDCMAGCTGSSQVVLEASKGLTRAHDTALVSAEQAGGIAVSTLLDSRVELVNLTVAGNDGTGIHHNAQGSATQSMVNTLAYANAGGNVMLTGSPRSDSHNLIDQDPPFLDPGAGDWRLAEGSPAIDAGTLTPPGGLASLDAALQPRVSGLGVDMGAFEQQPPVEIFGSGFEGSAL